MFGYGATATNQGYGRSNDSAALGGLIGFNVGLAAAAGVSAVYIPSYKSLAAMWIGAGAGFALSLPVYLLYAGDGGPPAKRGLIFSGVATTLGVGAGALFTFDSEDSASTDDQPRFARIYGFSPFALERGAGLVVTGELQ
jgi:MFS family permease